jgi:hypothetical protein
MARVAVVPSLIIYLAKTVIALMPKYCAVT